MGGSGDPAKKTQEQLALERRQRMQLDEETAASERRLKAVAQKKLGKQSLLATAKQEVVKPKGQTITEGYIKDKSGGLKKIPEGRGRKSISGAVGGVAGSGGAMGAISGSKKSKKKALFGGLF
jgi:S-adenosylmethionine synthetase